MANDGVEGMQDVRPSSTEKQVPAHLLKLLKLLASLRA